MIKSKSDNIYRNNRYKKNQSGNIFDKRSLQYNDLNWVFDPNFAKAIFRFINPLISEILLDLGTGTGAISLFLYKYVLKVYALDVSIQMVKKAQALLGDAPNVEFVVADGLTTCFYSESFNVIVCRNSLHHYDDPVAGLQEIYRILIKKGRFILIEPVAPDQKGKKLWCEFFLIRDKGRHPDFYFTNDEIIKFIQSNSKFSVKNNERFSITMPMHNWLNTGCVSADDQKKIFNILEQNSPESNNALGARYINNQWVMDHNWSLLYLTKEHL